MRNVKGIAVNIDRNVAGKVEAPCPGESPRSQVKVRTGGEPEALYLLGGDSDMQERRQCGQPFVYNIEDITCLKSDDVVLVNPTGLVTVVYRRGSNDNSIIVTERCNCSCLTCPQPPRACPSYCEINKRIISLVDKDAAVLGLTGGEPTTVPDELIELIAFCKVALPSTSLDLLTNGIALSDISLVRRIVSIHSPNLSFHIPLFADTDTEHNHMMRAEGFDRTIEGLYNLARFNQSIEIRIVVTAFNWQRLERIAEFIYRNFPFVRHVAFMGLEPIGNALTNINSLWVDPYDIRHELRRAIQCLHRADIDVSIFNITHCVLPRELRDFARQSISDWKTIYLDICQKCATNTECCGLFAASESLHSRFLSPSQDSIRSSVSEE